MRILILGAGVIGVTTAYYLAKAGYEVTILDRNDKPAKETSFANGGQLSYAHAEPWSHPSVWSSLPSILFSKKSPLRISKPFDPEIWQWCLKFLSHARLKTNQTNTAAIYKLALESKQCLQEIIDETALDFYHTKAGKLHVFHREKTLQHATEEAKFKQQIGCSYSILTHQQCIEKEATLAQSQVTFAGGVYYPDDEAGDIHLFTQNLLSYIEQRYKVNFLPNHRIQKIVTQGGSIDCLVTDKGSLKFDQYVLCLGAESGRLLETIGIKSNIYPLKGYSLTIPVADASLLPKVSVTVADRKYVSASLGNKLRVAGFAEFAGYDRSVDRNGAMIQSLYHDIMSVFPSLSTVDPDAVHYWGCLRSSTPSGLPLIGKSPYENLFLNTGQGSLGWTLACGSAKRLLHAVKKSKKEAIIAD